MESLLPIIDRESSRTADSFPDWSDSRHLKLFEVQGRWFAFLPGGSRLYEVDQQAFLSLDRSLELGDEATLKQLDEAGLLRPGPVRPEVAPGIYSMSLAVAQTCNLGCSYCYAEQGTFGRPATSMSAETAYRAIDYLVGQVPVGQKFNLTFLGGEPLLNRALIRQATKYAKTCAEERGLTPTFSLTTNATLLNDDDAEFFETHEFSVTISVDGVGEAHDQLRPFRNGRPTSNTVMDRAIQLIHHAKRMQVSARVTVTPSNGNLLNTLETLIGYGFHSVGFSPLIAAPNGQHEMQPADLETHLASMIECGEQFRTRLLAGVRYPFSNMVTALEQIHKGANSPYPCGAGLSYFGVGADGELSACHRFVGDAAGAMGSLESGVDSDRQNAWLSERHVDAQAPCRSCWARYLCGGGCHHEVIHRGRPSCEFVRGWLEYCLGVYAALRAEIPEYFGQT